jgi:hypothetical protein
MNSNDEEKQSQENIQQNKDNLVRKDSFNINDNEANKILNKEETISESAHLKLNVNNIKDKENNDFYHDKDITEDSIIYFTNKIVTYNHNYKFILYISIILYTIDIFTYFKSDKLLHTYYNLFSILLILISSLHQAFSFRHNFEPISKELYAFIKKVLFIYIIFFILYIINMLYLLIIKLIEIFTVKYVYLNKTQENFIMTFYIFSNIAIPTIVLLRFLEVKKGIKDLSLAKGEVYESSKIQNVEVINSVINKI